MNDTILAFFSLFLSEQNQFITLFLSAFLSATILPGNSEILFTALISQAMISEQSIYTQTAWQLLLVATLGNSLGSIVTYWMGRLLQKPKAMQHRYANWVLSKYEKYGVFMLLFSSLPIVGDLFCAIAGWLRLNFWQSLICIVIGKFARYLILLIGIYPLLDNIIW